MMIGSRHSFGGQFAEVRVNADTGEIRVSRDALVFFLLYVSLTP